MLVQVPYGRTFMEADIPDGRLQDILTPLSRSAGGAGAVLVRKALARPFGGTRLSSLASEASKIVVISSDHTRPLPSRLTMPCILAEIQKGNPKADITILVATGLHRAPTADELRQKYGPEIAAREHIVAHNAEDRSMLVRLRDLPSGAPFWVSRLACEADLLVAEGFIEPHFFAGFSGGRKSILPGISGQETILFNHSAKIGRAHV
jgi:nickel-dependent lactate racemase